MINGTRMSKNITVRIERRGLSNINQKQTQKLKRCSETQKEYCLKHGEGLLPAQRRVQAVQLEVIALQKEASALKACLRNKESRVEELVEENQKLQKELEAKHEKARTAEKEAKLLKILNSMEREKLRLVEFENTLKDRKLRHLERQVTVASVNAVFAATAGEEASTRRSPGVLETSLNPRSLAKLRKHAANYTNRQRNAETRTRLSR